MSKPQNQSPQQSVVDVVCAGCSCLCDDIALRVDSGQIIRAENACELGQAWFGRPRASARECRLDAKPASYAAAIEQAARVLLAARSPALFGLAALDSRAQQVALAIGDRIGACVDGPTSLFHADHVRAVQMRGEVTCTYGEIAERSDLILYWGTDPARTQPRHAERYSRLSQGGAPQTEARPRSCVVIASKPCETERWADEVIRILPGSDLEASWVVRAILRGIDLDPAEVSEQTGVPIEIWQRLVDRMAHSHYGALFYGDGIAAAGCGSLVAESLIQLAIELNDHTRFVSMALNPTANGLGVDEVVTWTTGYSYAVDLSRGVPRHFYDEYSTENLLTRREVDAVLWIGSLAEHQLSPSAAHHLRSIPRVVIDCSGATTDSATAAVIPDVIPVTIPVAMPGLESGGIVYRNDAVPLPLRGLFAAPVPRAEQTLSDLLAAIEQAAVGTEDDA